MMYIQRLFIDVFFILSYILFFFSSLILIVCSSDFDYHKKKRLNNGNYLYMTTKGIYIANEGFTSKISLVDFGTRIISSNFELYMSDIEQFSTNDNGYIICLIKNETYFLSKKGDLLKHLTLDYISKGFYYNIIPLGKYNNQNNQYYYVIIDMEDVENNKIMVFREYIFDSSNNEINFHQKYERSIANIDKNGISCELMNYLDNSKVITCFYGSWSETFYSVYDINDFNLISENFTGKISNELGINGGQLFVSTIISQNREEAICCFMHSTDFGCFKYNIANNDFSNVQIIADGNSYQCDCEILDMLIEYFPETKETLVGCKGFNKELYIGKYSTDSSFNNYGKINIILPSECGNPNLFHFIYSSNNKYSLVYDSKCEDQRVFNLDDIPSLKLNDYPTDEIGILICENYFNYEQTGCIDTLENGYYCNDTSKKTIDKCHDDCETCEYGPTEQYKNCKECKNSLFADFGQCVSTCSNGTYIDPKDNKIKCKCKVAEKCLSCNPQSYENELCVSCNKDQGYYPLEKDYNKNYFIECYKNPDKYYLKNNSFYKSCYKKCQKCNKHGNDANHNCIECIEDYTLTKDFGKSQCYKKCDYYYYYNTTNHRVCTINNSCPENLTKIVNSTNRCVKECSDDENNMYEYDNQCYSSCPSGTHKINEESYKCGKLSCDILYSYDRAECITEPPIGFYINSTEDKTIDKCHDNCKTCNGGPSDNNNNCTKCPDENTIYFDLGNCTSECINGFFTDNEINKCKCSTNKTCKFCSEESKSHNLCETCNEGYFPKKDDPNNIDTFINCYNNLTISDNYYLNIESGQYELCHSNCIKCSGHGDDTDNKCIICKEGYSLIKNKENIINCYSNCDYYYYFDDSNIYHCTDNFSCPSGYKLINEKKKCIDNCIYDDIYNYEYNNICYEICPNDAYSTNNNTKLCELNCKKNNKYFNYEKTECIANIPEGYFCNNIDINTIEKCHNNCKTCNKGPTEFNNNCETCKNEVTIFFDLGNCTDNCENGYFEEGTIKKCKCTSDKKCYYCSEESKILNLCVSCNEGYYKKKNDELNNGIYFNCYNNETISENYFLNIINNQYEPCHINCKNCEEEGNDIDNKCKECKLGYSFIMNNNNISNCYEDCNKLYYFNSNNEYKCEEKCPEGYKIIESTNKCIDKCINDYIYNHNFEYNGYCFEDCPHGTHISNVEFKLCEANLNCSNFYNYTQTGCIDKIPDGYYLNSSSLKTIDKCHENCKTCKEGPTESNNNCETCPETGKKFLDLGNCTDHCINGNFTFENENGTIYLCKCSNNIKCEYCSKESLNKDLCITCNLEQQFYPKINEAKNDGFINCYNNPEQYYLNDSKYYPCYETCNKCNELGNEKENKCTECKSNYSTKNDFENDNNCYINCPYNYYYDSERNYKCTTDDNCPQNYSKLISPKKRCIDDCEKDSNYKFEYRNECFIECPNSTHISNDNPFKCIDNLNCEKDNKYYNYERTDCIDTIPDGFYCNDSELKTIEKCHINCKKCQKGPLENNNNCEICKDNYYKKKNDELNNGIYFNCYNNETISENYFLNIINNQYEPCHINCKNCEEEGNDIDNKCKECKLGYSFIMNNNNISNCYEDCNKLYYFNSNNEYKCEEKCPEGYKIIESTNKCIDKCINDNIYSHKYDYNGYCYENCPSNTNKISENSYFCKEKTNELVKNINNLIINTYSSQILSNNNDSFYIEVTEDKDYNVLIFKNTNSTEKDEKDKIQIDFGECYEKIKKENNIDKDEELIISKVDGKKGDKPSAYAFYHPLTLEKLDSSSCENKSIIVKESFNKTLEAIEDKKEKFIRKLIEQGINVFNQSDDFYRDICYHYESPNGKDVPLKARLKAFFPNITLCETGCENVGFDLVLMKAKCECKFIDLVNMDLMGDNIYTQAIMEILDVIGELNIAVVKCVKDIFNKEKFIKCTGGFIIFSLFMGQIICLVKFAIDGLYFIRKYFFNLTQSFLAYTGVKESNRIFFGNHKNSPPLKNNKKKVIVSKNLVDKNCSTTHLNKKSPSSNKGNNSSSKINIMDSYRKKNLIINKPTIKPKGKTFLKRDTNKIIQNKRNTMIPMNRKKLSKINVHIKNTENKDHINMKEYLSLSFNENDYDDVVEKEKTTFCSYFSNKFKENQIFINTFFIKDHLRPTALKCLALIITIELYFVITALFYNEDYLTDLFYSEKEEKIYSFIPRKINQFIYTSAIVGFISYFIDYFFVEELKIKKIFIRNRNSDMKIKYEIAVITKDIGKRFKSLIFFSLFLTIICFIYISCFNNVYPYIKGEWIKCSLFIIILMQIINFAFTLLQCSVRFIAIKCKSERLFKLSQIL